MAHRVFEPVPLLVAAAVGAFVLTLVSTIMNASNPCNPNNANAAPTNLLLGALTGLGVQIAVRVTGVS